MAHPVSTSNATFDCSYSTGDVHVWNSVSKPGVFNFLMVCPSHHPTRAIATGRCGEQGATVCIDRPQRRLPPVLVVLTCLPP